VGKHCNNPRCVKKKLQSKIDKDHFEKKKQRKKIHKKNKNNHVGKHYSNS
jgi:hypothetical protein